MTMTEADTINLCRLAEWLEKLALHGTESAGWPTYSKVLDHVSSIRAALDEVDRLRDHAEALDKSWEAVHEAAMRPIRAALGLPEGTVPELLGAIARLAAERDALVDLCVYRTWVRRPRTLANAEDRDPEYHERWTSHVGNILGGHHNTEAEAKASVRELIRGAIEGQTPRADEGPMP